MYWCDHMIFVDSVCVFRSIHIHIYINILGCFRVWFAKRLRILNTLLRRIYTAETYETRPMLVDFGAFRENCVYFLRFFFCLSSFHYTFASTLACSLIFALGIAYNSLFFSPFVTSLFSTFDCIVYVFVWFFVSFQFSIRCLAILFFSPSNNLQCI